MMWEYGVGWHWLGWLGMALFWLIPVLLVLVAVKYLGSKPTPPPGSQTGKTALDYLNEAYAKGEISRDEFLQKRADLKGQ
ncbi:MAG TPA: SHOCT domain-containing protein [Thauera aminoaromatica]|nr:SHOCT domain-containing protein [Thauera aminoaromatica]